ncbi:MAG: chorismate mutase, partial [Megasphaera micronuciformis]|nr:chorismate mutase [Megasphaera micronuciformis]
MKKIYCFSTKGMKDMNLTASRQQIDEIDKQITALLEERMKAVA